MAIQNLTTSDAVALGEFVQVAYQMYDDNPGNPNPPPPSYFPAGWNLVVNLSVDPVLGIFSQVEFIGFIAQSAADPLQYAIVFRGTQSDLDWISDFEFWMTPFTEVPNAGQAEHGFLAVYRTLNGVVPGESVRAPLGTMLGGLIPTNASVTVTGHSLGGALAVLHAAVLSSSGIPGVMIVTFAAPMVGDRQFSTTFMTLVPNSARIYNKPDIVPDLPGTLLGYTQVQAGIGINSLDYPEIQWTISCFHSLLTYLYMLGSTKYGLGSCAASARPMQVVTFPAAPGR
jgi:triacylglycerol lipase